MAKSKTQKAEDRIVFKVRDIRAYVNELQEMMDMLELRREAFRKFGMKHHVRHYARAIGQLEALLQSFDFFEAIPPDAAFEEEET